MYKSIAGALAAVVTVATSVSALAAPITTNPGPINANGQSYAVYVFADAADRDQLRLVNFGGTALFDNKASAVGDTQNLGVRFGNQVFTLSNVTTGLSFSTGVLDTDGAYHARYSTNYASFNVGQLPGPAATALNALPAGQSVLYVGFEDLRNSDYDYNDLIFAFVTPVAEPSSLAILGAALLGVGMIRRRLTA